MSVIKHFVCICTHKTFTLNYFSQLSYVLFRENSAFLSEDLFYPHYCLFLFVCCFGHTVRHAGS